MLFILVIISVCSCVCAQKFSRGCGRAPPATPNLGTTSNIAITFDDMPRSYRLHVPATYKATTPSAVIFSFHGWGSSSSFHEQYMGFTKISDDNGVLMVYPEGRSDYQIEENAGWQSWNTVGSTTTLGEECTPSTTGFCYLSCKKRSQGCGRCDWTTCARDTVFTESILNSLEALYCVDKTRIYATGFSNGGIMAYHVGRELNSRFAAVVPGGGTPFVGHNNPPNETKGLISVLDLHGDADNICPANSTTSTDGWNYIPVDDVLKVWGTATGCVSMSTLRHFLTSEDGNKELYCVKLGDCPQGIDIVRCSYKGGHDWPGYSENGGLGARLAWNFMKAHPKVDVEALSPLCCYSGRGNRL
eukprot:m.12355 g.12355  ORF g.12355 m.12355 type:complete len:359 (+) comp4638_c0_seq1:402-1478(+)